MEKLGLNELHVRAVQFLAMLRERHGVSSLTQLPTDDELLSKLCESSRPHSTVEFVDLFRARPKPMFFGAFNERELTLNELQQRLPLERVRILERANSIRAGRFSLLGFENLTFGEPIDWHREPISGKSAPNLHWSRLNFLDPNVVGDKKIIWELNRHQYFSSLGQAYWLTGDESYSQTFCNHLNWWMDQNPPKIGINWASSLEVAFRSISWIWALYFFRESKELTAEIFTRAIKFLYLHARHLETYLSTYFSPNTHLTGEALGLFYLGTFLPEFKESERWRTVGFQILMEQLKRQVKPDGVYFEQTSYYHRYTTDFYIHLLILLRINGQAVPAELEESLVKLLDHLMYITRPDGSTPLFGDDDGGRLVTLSERAPNDFRGTLATGAVLFNRADYKYVAGDVIEEALWLLGAEAIRAFDHLQPTPPTKQSRGFPDGGYYVMRDGWSSDSNYLWFDCGPHGTLNCGHAHADTLSFELVANGRPLLLDPGTYTYTGSSELRDWFRSSAAHNTLTIDHKSSSVAAGPFSWKSIARSETLKWITQERFDFLAGRHDGYDRLEEPTSHSRSIMFLKKNYWILRDKVSSEGEQRADIWFHFDTNANPLIEAIEQGQSMLSVDADVGGLDIYCFADQGSWRREEGWISPCYGKKLRAPVSAFSSVVKGEAEAVSFIFRKSSPPAARYSVREIEAIGGKAFEVSHSDGFDIVMIRSDKCSVVETARLASDFEFTWVRFSAEESLPQEFVLIGGQSLNFAGSEFFRWKKRIQYSSGYSLGETFHVVTPDGKFDLSLPMSDCESNVVKLS